MSIKKLKIISVISIFLLSFLVHYGYEIFPNFITSIIFPINESLFEHMKLISTVYFIWSMIEYKFIKNNINYKADIILSIFINIIIFLIIFYPIYLNYNHNLFVTLSIYLISIIITQVFSYYILKYNKKLIINDYFYELIGSILLIDFLFTYYPLNNNFFIDYMNKKIGFSNYY